MATTTKTTTNGKKKSHGEKTEKKKQEMELFNLNISYFLREKKLLGMRKGNSKLVFCFLTSSLFFLILSINLSKFDFDRAPFYPRFHS